ncbi:MAG TPA: hypothetical protein VGP79_09670 [Bryobacteraceae bacterium]|nr:hypothetical protein [Bryobacteraceae bacterium]
MAGGRFAALLLVCSAAGWAADAKTKPLGPQFQTSDRCIGCHNGLTTQAGEDISIGFDWRATMMANSSRDPYWQAGVRRETIDHPESKAAIEDECAKCHMPMARYQAHLGKREGEVFSHLKFDLTDDGDRLAADGVSCSLCHQIGKEKLGTRDSFVGGFVIDPPTAEGERPEYGPFKIENGLTRVMRSSSRGFRPTEASHIRQSEVCATCHTLITKALGPGGKVIAEFPEQVPYQEWLHSEFREKQSCQACHMPVVKEDVAITNVLGTPREGVSRHVFVGGNFFILRMLNRYRDELSVAALAPEMEAAVERTVTHLQTQTARIAVNGAGMRSGRLEFDVAVENLGGHKLPTAYPSRRAWLHVVVRDRNNRVVFESGAVNASGAIQGADGDADPKKFEPHYTEIRSADQVQIYESVMSDSAGTPTTALLQAVRYLKDNRLLPRGFDKRSADQEIAVVGGAADDADFMGGGDRVRYSVDVAGAEGPLQIEAELMFQPISFRWAANLKSYDTAETKRFTSYYDAMSSKSAVKLAGATASFGRGSESKN